MRFLEPCRRLLGYHLKTVDWKAVVAEEHVLRWAEAEVRSPGLKEEFGLVVEVVLRRVRLSGRHFALPVLLDLCLVILVVECSLLEVEEAREQSLEVVRSEREVVWELKKVAAVARMVEPVRSIWAEVAMLILVVEGEQRVLELLMKAFAKLEGELVVSCLSGAVVLAFRWVFLVC